jgi:hypothetical protein
VSRKYALTKIGKGDYIVPSNDAEKLFRVTQVDDIDNDKPVRVWSVHVYDTLVARMGDDLPDDFLEWKRWTEVSHFHRTRQDALDDALDYTPRIERLPSGGLVMRLW